MRHYLHPTDADFQRATAAAGVDEENSVESVEVTKDGTKYRSTVDAKIRVH